MEGTCETLPPNAPAVCAETGDCEGGRACVDAECRFVPTCQTVLDDQPFRWLATCATGGALSGDASPTSSGCQVSFAIQGLAGQNRTLEIGPLSGEDTRVTGLATTAGDVTCPAGAWNGATSTLLLTGCVVGADTCDIMLSRRRDDATLCLNDGFCGGDACAADVEVGTSVAGRCP